VAPAGPSSDRIGPRGVAQPVARRSRAGKLAGG
jgi:hypothetical protein